MRADKNWEDSIGKKLFEFEGELSPQAWDNISKKIQPKRRNRWFIWLPLVLFFCGLPLAVYYANKSGLIHLSSENTTTSNSKSTQTGLDKLASTRTAQPTGNERSNLKHSTEPTENSGKQNEQLAQTKEIKQENLPEHYSTTKTNLSLPSKSEKPELLPALIAENPKNLITEKEKNSEGNAIEKRQKSKNRVRNYTTAKSLIATSSKPKTTEINYSKKQKAAGKSGKETNELSLAKTGNPVVQTSKIADANSANIQAGTKQNTGLEINPGLTETKTVGKEGSNPGITPAQTAPAPDKNIVAGKAKTDSTLISKTVAVIPVENAPVDSSTTKEKEKEDEKMKWSFSIYGTPQYTVQQVAPNEKDEILILKLNNKNDFSSERIGYEFGLRSYYPLNKNLQFELGLHFTRLNQHLNLTTASPLADSIVTVSQNNPVKLEVLNRQLNEDFNLKYFYGGLFVGGNAALGQNLKFTAGLGLNGLVAAKPKDTARELESKTLNPYVSAGLKYNYKLSSALILQAGPVIQYYLKPIQKKTSYFTAQPTTFGFSIGILFQPKP